jgi:hypothetical protein
MGFGRVEILVADAGAPSACSADASAVSLGTATFGIALREVDGVSEVGAGAGTEHDS